MMCAACGMARCRCRCRLVARVAEAVHPTRYPLPPRLKAHRTDEARQLIERLERSGLRIEEAD